MQSTSLLKALAIGLLACCASCSGDPNKTNAKSINVDSTNQSGAAPVRYGADNPADTESNLSTADDTGRRSNTSAKPE